MHGDREWVLIFAAPGMGGPECLRGQEKILRLPPCGRMGPSGLEYLAHDPGERQYC